jgi:hypothetical protein
VLALVALHVWSRPVQPAKVLGVHSSLPVFFRIAYGWLLIARRTFSGCGISRSPQWFSRFTANNVTAANSMQAENGSRCQAIVE